LIGALLGYLILLWIKERKVAGRLVRWVLVVLLPPLPVLVIYVLFLMYNPAMVEWNRQNAAVAPSLLLLIIGLGLPLMIAFPSIYRTIRRFEPDGSQYMGVWLLAMIITVYLPTGAHTRFAAGIMIPIAYFGTRSLEDFWFGFVRGRWRFRLLAAVLPLIVASQILVLITPLFPIFEGKPQDLSNLLLERDYRDAFDWLEMNTRPTDIVLAAPTVGVWLPAWSGARTVYGHPAETLDAGIKRQAVLNWYRQDEDDPDACEPLLRGDYTFTRPYRVGYVLVGPQETALGVAACARSLNLVAVSGSVRIFSVAELPATESPQQP
jgi:hypothetical protein